MRPTSESTLDFRNTNSLWCSVLVETLVRAGLKRVVISPGSRSAPLTFAFAAHPAIEAVSVLDERSAAFFALGLAKKNYQPVALVCTSGTAGANYFPAVIEARESGVPLLVLTADRPPEMRDCRSGQTIDQLKLFGGYVNFHHECAVPEATLPMLRYLRQTVIHACRMTARPQAGPVHLNCPFRDPLPPVSQALPAGIDAGALAGFFDEVEGWPTGPTVEIPMGGGEWPVHGRKEDGLIVVGPNDPVMPRHFALAVERVSRALGWPVLADALSPVRTHGDRVRRVVAHYDAILRSPKRAQALRPQRVLCIGDWPTSKVLRAWLQAADPAVLMVGRRAVNPDALHLRTSVVHADFVDWSQYFRGRVPYSRYAKRWHAEERRMAPALAAGLAGARGLVEPAVTPVLASALPEGAELFVASSMPVRDLEYFWPVGNRGQRILFNRGANGIDGTLSTALGAAQGRPGPSYLLTGDLALLHDTNGFLSVPKFTGNLTIVLINNQGGGIFGHLPVAQFEPPFEEFFATPQQVDFARLCATYGVAHVRVRSLGQLAKLVANPLKRGVRVLEVRTDRKRDAAFRKRLFADVAESAG